MLAWNCCVFPCAMGYNILSTSLHTCRVFSWEGLSWSHQGVPTPHSTQNYYTYSPTFCKNEHRVVTAFGGWLYFF